MWRVCLWKLSCNPLMSAWHSNFPFNSFEPLEWNLFEFIHTIIYFLRIKTSSYLWKNSMEVLLHDQIMFVCFLTDFPVLGEWFLDVIQSTLTGTNQLQWWGWCHQWAGLQTSALWPWWPVLPEGFQLLRYWLLWLWYWWGEKCKKRREIVIVWKFLTAVQLWQACPCIDFSSFPW